MLLLKYYVFQNELELISGLPAFTFWMIYALISLEKIIFSANIKVIQLFLAFHFSTLIHT